MSWQTLRPQFGTLLDTVSSIQEVSTTPKVKFGGYPAATVTPSDNLADYETNTENTRTYAFTIRLFQQTKKKGVAGAISVLEKVVDSVLDLLDQEDQKTSATRTIGINLPSGYTYLNIWAVPGRWGELPGEQLIMAELTVGVRISRDIS